MRGLLSAGAGAAACEFGLQAGQRLGSGAGGPRQMKGEEGGAARAGGGRREAVEILPTD